MLCPHGSPCGYQKSSPVLTDGKVSPGLERLYPTRFSKPEVQISLNNSFNQTVNALSITLSTEEVREIEAVAEPSRQKVRQMFEAYRPSHGNGDQDPNGSVSMSVQEKFANYRPDSGNGE